MSDKWKLRFITDWNVIYSSSFQKEWLFWCDNATNSHVFFHPALCMAWIETYRPIRRLDPLLCIAENGEKTLFIPLFLWSRNWRNLFQSIVIPAGYSDFDYHDPILSCPSKDIDWLRFFSVLTDSLKSLASFDSIDINGLRIRVINENCSQEDDIAPFCDLDLFSDFEEFFRSLKPSLRGDIKRQIRRINALGPMSIYEYNDVNEALDILPVFLKLHSLRWPGAYVAPLLHHNLIRSGIDSGLVHFTALIAGGEKLSYHFGFKYKYRYYYYMPVINPEFENISPGKVHLFKLVEYALSNGFKIFDYLRGDENYKTGWTNNIQSLYRFSLESKRTGSVIRNTMCNLKAKLF